jgi:DNA-binding HxlR family transcriptional regulator
MASQAPPVHDEAFSRSLRAFSRRGTLDILELLLLRGPARFSEIRRALPGIAERLVWERLREMTDADLIARAVDAGPPITSTYEVTERGVKVHARLADLRDALSVNAGYRA